MHVMQSGALCRKEGEGNGSTRAGSVRPGYMEAHVVIH